MDEFEFPKCAVFYTRTAEGLLEASEIRDAFKKASAKKYGDLYGGKFLIQQAYPDVDDVLREI